MINNLKKKTIGNVICSQVHKLSSRPEFSHFIYLRVSQNVLSVDYIRSLLNK